MKALVTGGGGFLGRAIVARLLERGIAVRSFSRQDHPHAGVEHVRGDLTDADAVDRAVEGCNVVFHVAAKAGVWGPYETYDQVNNVGTCRVMEACFRAGVSRLIYTSTPSVVFDGRDHQNVNESEPYATRWLAHYPRTKAMAERQVLGAHGPALTTVALRPHLIWGPGDNHLVPRILNRARAGKLRLVGRGDNLVDSVYVDNAADAHLLAMDAPADVVGGKAYFISNGEPMPMRELINRILAAAKLPPVTRSISPWAAYAIGATLEAIYTVFGFDGEPPMTRFVARQLATAHWFDLTAAKRDLGYAPRVSIDEGMKRLEASL